MVKITPPQVFAKQWKKSPPAKFAIPRRLNVHSVHSGISTPPSPPLPPLILKNTFKNINVFHLSPHITPEQSVLVYKLFLSFFVEIAPIRSLIAIWKGHASRLYWVRATKNKPKKYLRIYAPNMDNSRLSLGHYQCITRLLFSFSCFCFLRYSWLGRNWQCSNWCFSCNKTNTNQMPLVYFHTSWKYQKTRGFLMF